MKSKLFGGVGALAVWLVAGVTAVVAGDDMAAKLLAMEKTLWQAWADGNGAPFEEMLTAEAVHLSPAGRRGKAEMIAEFSEGSCEVGGFELMNPQAVQLAEGAVLLTYEATQQAACDGETLPGKVVAASVWVKRDGHWRNTYYQESPLAME